VIVRGEGRERIEGDKLNGEAKKKNY